jgi:ATP-dependent HslUV protease ATP-binding subunit HslU
MKTENVDLQFTDDGIESIADISTHINSTIENIGARRLHTILEKVLEDISFTASDRNGEKVLINKSYVEANLANIIKDKDLSRFIL